MSDRRRLQRQGKAAPKTRYQLYLTDENYDFLIRLANDEEISVAAILNRLITEKRRDVPQGTFVTP